MYKYRAFNQNSKLQYIHYPIRQCFTISGLYHMDEMYTYASLKAVNFVKIQAYASVKLVDFANIWAIWYFWNILRCVTCYYLLNLIKSYKKVYCDTYKNKHTRYD